MSEALHSRIYVAEYSVLFSLLIRSGGVVEWWEWWGGGVVGVVGVVGWWSGGVVDVIRCVTSDLVFLVMLG